MQQVAAFGLLDLLDAGVHADLGAGLIAFGQQHVEDVTGLVVAEQLAELLLVVGHAMLAHQLDEVPLGVAGQGRLAEMRILREEVARLGIHVGEVAAAAAGHEDLLAGLVGVVEHQYPAATAGAELGAHQAGGAGAEDDHVGGVHGVTSLLAGAAERPIAGKPAPTGTAQAWGLW
ncbi:hypothetical protein D3C85_1421430 [compost metagenome]